MNKVICDVCGTDYPETAAQCPICGCANTGGQTSAGNNVPNEEERPGYTYVKGGRFSKSNVRKRLKNGPEQEVRVPVPAYDDDEDEDQELDQADEQEELTSNRGLIVIVILLLLAIIAVSTYIILNFVDFCEDQPSNTGAQSTVQTPPASSDEPTNPIPCTGLTVTDSEITLAGFDTVWKLAVTVEPAGTTDKLVFESSDVNVATVDENGSVTAVGQGEATITIRCGEFQSECRVICDFQGQPTQPSETTPTDPEKPTEPTENVVLELNREDFTLSSKGASWNVYSGDIDPAEITWTSDNEKVATVTNGKVVAVGPGRTKIHAEYKGQKDSCWVSCSFPADEETEPTVEPTTEYAVYVNGNKPAFTIAGKPNSASVTLEVGESFSLTLVRAEDSAPITDVEWVISDETVCSMNGKKVTGLAKGNITITTTYEGQTFICQVYVKEAA